jgi:uncharacterized protein
MSLTLSALYIYPVKSLRGIAVSTAAVTDRGLHMDRRWMLVDAAGRFMSQRQTPRMALVSVAVREGGLALDAPGMEPLLVPFEAPTPEPLEVEVWRDRCEARTVGPSFDRWFTRFLGQDCRLVQMPEETLRPVDPIYAAHPDDHVSFADGYPFLLISEASLDDLNRRLRERDAAPVDMIRFRPNLVVRGAQAYAEDDWKRLRIASTEFRVVKPCSRCVIPTVDLATGEKGREPLATLTQYRRRDNKVFFGQNLVHEWPSVGPAPVLRVGDAVELMDPGAE